ncbi:hypothetical protein IWW37_004680 [Coemansia sp. RSA 2050]|nr:hypothetical protein IWW37_004680 [Coemansia sp. RSA 2050]KAJ2735242.1 hypothetical protein IW152_001761 [Coemansia sp. BCRC 34962]
MPHLDQKDLVQLCLVGKQTWQLVVLRLWERPILHTIEQFERFSNTVGSALPFGLRNYQRYGDLPRKLDLSMLARRWDKLGYDLLAPVFKHCSRLSDIDMSLCQALDGDQFERLFADNPQIGKSLGYLDISETSFSVAKIVSVLNMLPELTYLLVNETKTDDSVLEAISKSLPDLVCLQIDRCELVSDIGIKALADGCPNLTCLSTRECWGILDTELVDEINAGNGWEDLDDPQNYDSYDYTNSEEEEYEDDTDGSILWYLDEYSMENNLPGFYVHRNR